MFDCTVTRYDAVTGSRAGRCSPARVLRRRGRRRAVGRRVPEHRPALDGRRPVPPLASFVPFRRPLSAETNRFTMRDMAVGEGSLWVIGDAVDRRVFRVDDGAARSSARRCCRSRRGRSPAGEGGVWVTGPMDDVVARLDPATGAVSRSSVARGASGVAVGAGRCGWRARSITSCRASIQHRGRSSRDPDRGLPARGHRRCGRRLGDGRCRVAALSSSSPCPRRLRRAVAGCGTDEPVVRIGVLADCQGALRGFGDGELAGAELPFLRRGARLLGTGPSGGVSAIDVGGRRVELVQGCQETGEHTLYIEEARRLLENEHVDVVVGGASVVARELARRYPACRSSAPSGTSRRSPCGGPRRTCSASRPTTRSMRRGSGRTRTTSSAGDEPPSSPATQSGVGGRGGLHGRVLRARRPGGRRRLRRARPDRWVGARAGRAARRRRHVPRVHDDPAKILGSLASQLDDPRRLLVWAPNLEDPELLQTLGRRLDGVVGDAPGFRRRLRRLCSATTGGAGASRSPGFPPAFADHSCSASATTTPSRQRSRRSSASTRRRPRQG